MILMRMLKGIGLLILGGIASVLIVCLLIIGFLAFGVEFAFIIALIAAVTLTVHLLRKYGRLPERGRTVIRVEPDVPLYWHDCDHCTKGVQTLYLGAWGPIPKHLRITQDGVRMFQPPRGNARNCTHCRGRGGYLLPYRPRNEEGEELAIGPASAEEIAQFNETE